MKKYYTLFVALVMAMFLVGCEDSAKYEVTAWKTLAISATAYDKTMTELGSLHSQGKITDEVAKKAVSFGEKFTPLYLTAVNTLETFVKNPSDNGIDVVKNAIDSAVSSLDLLLDFAKSFGIDTTKESESLVTDENAKDIAKSLESEVK